MIKIDSNHLILMHSFLSFLGYIVVFLALSIYLNSARRRGIHPGESFKVSTAVKIYSAVVLLGLPAGLFYYVPKAAHAFAALAVASCIGAAFGAMYAILVSCELIISRDGFRVVGIFSGPQHYFHEFDDISIYRYSVMIRRKEDGRSVAIPAVFTAMPSIYHHLRDRIKSGDQ